MVKQVNERNDIIISMVVRRVNELNNKGVNETNKRIKEEIKQRTNKLLTNLPEELQGSCWSFLERELTQRRGLPFCEVIKESKKKNNKYVEKRSRGKRKESLPNLRETLWPLQGKNDAF